MNFIYSHANASMLFTPNFPLCKSQEAKQKQSQKINTIFSQRMLKVYIHFYSTLYVAGCYGVAGTIHKQKKYVFVVIQISSL